MGSAEPGLCVDEISKTPIRVVLGGRWALKVILDMIDIVVVGQA